MCLLLSDNIIFNYLFSYSKQKIKHIFVFIKKLYDGVIKK